MSQTKFKMPDYIRQAVVWLCKGYDDNVAWYKIRYQQLFGKNYRLNDMPYGGGHISLMEDKMLDLESHNRTRIIRAIDKAKMLIGMDLENNEIRCRLKTAIWESTLDSRGCPYEIWNLPTVCRDDFYERKREFIKNIAIYLDLM